MPASSPRSARNRACSTRKRPPTRARHRSGRGVAGSSASPFRHYRAMGPQGRMTVTFASRRRCGRAGGRRCRPEAMSRACRGRVASPRNAGTAGRSDHARFFVAAGISEGMRVLDVGSGAGHTALLLAGLSGPPGRSSAPTYPTLPSKQPRAAPPRPGSERIVPARRSGCDGIRRAVRRGRRPLRADVHVRSGRSLARLARHLRRKSWSFTSPIGRRAVLAAGPSFDLLCAWIGRLSCARRPGSPRNPAGRGLRRCRVAPADTGARGDDRFRLRRRRYGWPYRGPRHDASARHGAPRNRRGERAGLRGGGRADSGRARPERHRRRSGGNRRLDRFEAGKCRLLLPGACEPRLDRLSPGLQISVWLPLTRQRPPEHSCRWQLSL